jgi:hypothetical protein
VYTTNPTGNFFFVVPIDEKAKKFPAPAAGQVQKTSSSDNAKNIKKIYSI